MAYPLPKFHFRVDWGGTNIGFTEVSGLTIEHEKLEYREGSSPEYFKKAQIGMKKLSDITMKQGVFQNDNEFYEWYNTVALNHVDKRDITISLLNEQHEPCVVWNVKDCFILKLECTDLKSDANENAIQTIVLANNGFTVEHV